MNETNFTLQIAFRHGKNTSIVFFANRKQEIGVTRIDYDNKTLVVRLYGFYLNYHPWIEHYSNK